MSSASIACETRVDPLTLPCLRQGVSSLARLFGAVGMPGYGRDLECCFLPLDLQPINLSLLLHNPSHPHPHFFPPPHTRTIMASALRLGSSALRSSLTAPAFNARIAAFNGLRYYSSSKSQVCPDQSPRPSEARSNTNFLDLEGTIRRAITREDRADQEAPKVRIGCGAN